MDALGINLSEGGMCLFVMANLTLGSQIQVQFCAPQSKEIVRYPATIRHRALYLYGVEFVPESEIDQSGWMRASAISAD